jgi:hypothetical protein
MTQVRKREGRSREAAGRSNEPEAVPKRLRGGKKGTYRAQRGLAGRTRSASESSEKQAGQDAF